MVHTVTWKKYEKSFILTTINFYVAFLKFKTWKLSAIIKQKR
jgi:hypothetical protein